MGAGYGDAGESDREGSHLRSLSAASSLHSDGCSKADHPSLALAWPDPPPPSRLGRQGWLLRTFPLLFSIGPGLRPTYLARGFSSGAPSLRSPSQQASHHDQESGASAHSSLLPSLSSRAPPLCARGSPLASACTLPSMGNSLPSKVGTTSSQFILL